MRSKSAIRLFAYACIAIPALILFVENRFFEAGAIGWLWIGILAIAIVESYVVIGWRKAVTPPYPNGPSNRPLVGSTNGPSHSSTDVELPALSEHNSVMNTEYKMKSNQGWCPLNPKELIDYVSPKDATEVARTQRSAMYKGKLLQVRGLVNEVSTFTMKSNYRIDVQDSIEYPWSWSVSAEVRSDQDDYVQSLHKGDQITITGTIGTISANYVGLEESYIDHSTTKPHPQNLIEPLDETNIPAWFLAALARSLRQVDGESDAMLSRLLLNALDRHISEISEEINYLGATKPRGGELRFMLTLLNRWCESPPTYPKSDKSK